ncbi:hypothetical protein UMNF18_IncI105 (plasmid) [Escherichia coli UMNF18]|uniref:hypothetical protein n=1 Tax=Escherichia coli TaxID=562 RepID=UPI000217D6A4|nr:hypothetical protein UMNF18_IncI105 [Escherichia coli UMNF18]
MAYWESAYLRRLAGLNVMPSSFEGCLMQTSQKSGINYLDIFRLNGSTRSTGSGNAAPFNPLPPPDWPGTRSVTRPLPAGTPDQNVYLEPRQAQRLSRHIGRFVPDRLRLRQRTDDLRTTARMETVLSELVCACHARKGNVSCPLIASLQGEAGLARSAMP